MKNTVKIAGIQMESEMGNKQKNLARAIEFIRSAAADGADIVCLPELFYTGYDLSKEEFAQSAESCDGKLIATLSKVARDCGVYIAASFAEKGEQSQPPFICCALIDDTGTVVGKHRKLYLWGEEKTKFQAGSSLAVFDTKFGTIGMLICYDIEFPEPARALALAGAQLILVPLVYEAGCLMDRYLAAIALQNLTHVLAVNTIGNLRCGGSKILDPKGDVIACAPSDREEIASDAICFTDGSWMEYPHKVDWRPDIAKRCVEIATEQQPFSQTGSLL